MLIKVPSFQWTRDEGVGELIEYLNQPERRGKLDKLGTADLRAITLEAQKCREDFTYAARNYFWIVDKEGREFLFRLWEAQELVLEKILELKARGRSQKLLIVKARQLGCSTLIEALIAWRVCYFPNINAMVVSYDDKHAAYLYGIMLAIYDRLPWWMKPMIRSRKFEDGLILDNPDPKLVDTAPGLNSRVDVKGATSISGVGTGFRLSAVHASEFAQWQQVKARQIIEKDLVHALADNPEVFAILESTAKGAGTYAHKLWKKSVELGDQSKWVPVFLPSFFDKSHFIPPPAGWVIPQEEKDIEKRASGEWLRCAYRPCSQFHMRSYEQRDRTGELCPTCETGTMKTYTPTPGFLHWMFVQRINAGGDAESLATLKQEQATSAEEAFQISGNPIFKLKAQEYANSTVRDPLAKAFFGQGGVLHGVDQSTGKCFVTGCEIDHRDQELPLKIYRWPQAGRSYSLGIDPGEGSGQDYSTGAINRKGTPSDIDGLCALYSSNTVDTIQFAREMVYLGRMYNEALAAPEINKIDTVGTMMSFTFGYGNMYRMRSLSGSSTGMAAFGWRTHVTSKPRLYLTLNSFLGDRLVEVCDREIVEELKTFVKEDDSSTTGAGTGFHDDKLMAFMIALYVAHESDWDEALNGIKMQPKMTIENSPWKMSCGRCEHQWPASDVGNEERCPLCGSRYIRGQRNVDPDAQKIELPEMDVLFRPTVPDPEPEYENL